ncbi:MAG: amino acid permease [Planctomycetota bacterium]|jgi:amino acid transporter
MSTIKNNDASHEQGKGLLGTFGGVFTPSILTILGLILFMRLGYVVGNAGLKRGLLMILLANAISILTSFSLSAIATNLRVKGGGDYYLISRTLGLSFGGAIGLVLFLAQSVSVAFYCVGFGEAVAALFPSGGALLPQIIAAAAALFLFGFAWLGADWATRLQYLIMAFLAASLVSFFVGGLGKFDPSILAHNWNVRGGDEAFWILFAIFFPAVTGFTQGVSMSGDLKNPARSLPLGTFSAVGISLAVYLGAAIVFAAAMTGKALAGDYGAMKQVAWIDWLIDAGVISATLSSALASFLGAPRILQSLARDKVFPFLAAFAKGEGASENPRRAVLLSAGIAFVVIAIGGLNFIAQLVSMFFLISYGLINYATYFEARSASPSFRPRFRWFHRRLSLLGALACLGVMVAIDWTVSLIAFSILFAVHQYLKQTAGPARWADSRRSFHLHNVRRHLLKAAAEPDHPRDWRPHLLVLSKDAHRREKLLRFASWIQGQSGFTTAVRIVEGEGLKAHKLRMEAEEELVKDIAAAGHQIFVRAVAASDLHSGLNTLIQGFGIGPLRANTLLLNWLEPIRKHFFGLGELRYGRNVRSAFRLGMNIIVFDADDEEWIGLNEIPAKERRIDVWWSDDATSRLMLLLAYLMTRSDDWSDAKIRVIATAVEKDCEALRESLGKMLDEVRIDAVPEVFTEVGLKDVQKLSTDASFVFLPFHMKGNNLAGPFGCELDDLFGRLPVVAMMLAAQDLDLDAAPEEGKAGAIAAARDASAEMEKKAMKATKEAGRAAERVEKLRKEIEKAREEGADAEALGPLKAEAREARTEATRLARRAAKALTKAEDAKRYATDLETKVAGFEEPAAPDGGQDEKGNKKDNGNSGAPHSRKPDS